MWKSNGCTLTPTVAARESAKSRQNPLVSRASPSSRGVSKTPTRARPVPTTRKQKKKSKPQTQRTPPPRLPSNRIRRLVARARVALARVRRTHANTSSRTPPSSDASRRLFSLRDANTRESIGRSSVPRFVFARAHRRVGVIETSSSRFPSRTFESHPSSVVVRRRARAPVPPSPTRMSLNVGICCPCGGADMSSSSSSSSVGASVPSARARGREGRSSVCT